MAMPARLHRTDILEKLRKTMDTEMDRDSMVLIDSRLKEVNGNCGTLARYRTEGRSDYHLLRVGSSKFLSIFRHSLKGKRAIRIVDDALSDVAVWTPESVYDFDDIFRCSGIL